MAFMARAVVLAGVVWLVGSGCSTSTDNARIELAPVGAPLDCRDPIDLLDTVPPSYRVVSDVVAFPDIEMHQRGRTGPEGGPHSARRFSKMGLVIRSGATFEIHVAGDSQDNAVIHWGNTGTGDLVSAIAIDSCSANAEWLVYPGGVWTLEPDCITLQVVTTETISDVRLPIGTSCK